MKPRSIVRAVGTGFFAGLVSSGSDFAQISDNVLRTGILNDATGTNAYAGGREANVVAELAAEDFGGTVAGAKIEIASGDRAWLPGNESNFPLLKTH